MSNSVAYPFTASGLIGPATTPNAVTVIKGLNVAETAGSSSVTVTLHEGSSSGKILGTVSVAGGASSPFVDFPNVVCNGQVYATKSGTGTLSAVLYIA